MKDGTDWAVAPAQGRIAKTVALASAILLGRRHILAERLTLRSRVAVTILAFWQLVLSLTAAWWLTGMLHRSGFSAIWQQGLSVWCLASSVIIWASLTWRVLGRFSEARRSARRLRVVMRTDGVCVYDPPLQANYEQQLESCLSLGVSRRWEGSLLGLCAPTLCQQPDFDDFKREWEFSVWVRSIQLFFEPGLLLRCSAACLLTLNLFWVLYFFVAFLCLMRAAELDRRWFESVGSHRYREEDLDRQAFDEWRRQARADAADEERRRYIVRTLPPPVRQSVDIDQAFRNLPDELRQTIDHDDDTESARRPSS